MVQAAFKMRARRGHAEKTRAVHEPNVALLNSTLYLTSCDHKPRLLSASIIRLMPIMATRLGKIHLYFKNIYIDYFEVFKEVRQNAHRRPLVASLYGASTLFVLNLFRVNEGLKSYTSEVISACNRIGAVTESSRNPLSNQFVHQVGELNCHGLLRQIDLGFSTLIYKADADPELALFRYNCTHLKPSFIELLTERIVDLGVLGHWLNLELKMQDYDINEEEYKDMPDK